MVRRVFFSVFAALGQLVVGQKYATHWFEQPCDHNDFTSAAPTFRQRFLVNDSWWSPGGPVLIYTGNEAPIEDFVTSVGFQWVLGEELGAMVVFAEHRFYGESATAPGSCGNLFSAPFRYLSASAALHDFARLIDHLRKDFGAAESTVVAIGGSYGGMLAAWLRAKFPELVDGALASSAPVVLGNEARPEGVYDIISSNFECAADIGEAFRSVLPLFADAAGRQQIARQFSLCAAPDGQGQINPFVGLLQKSFMGMAERNYPYAVNLPANPAAESCRRFRQAGGGLEGLAASVSVVPDTDSAQQPEGCVNLTALAPSFEATLPGLLKGGWVYQRCSDILIPYAAGPSAPLFLSCDEFKPNCWNLTRFSSWCADNSGALPQPRSAEVAFGGRRLAQQGLSRVVFTNGGFDPWRAGGLTAADISKDAVDVIAVEMAGGAHHLELRTPNPADPPDIVDGRDLQRHYIRKWISERATGAQLVYVWL
eukprot:TRINITY_DN62292_c0_g1_i1.p1 TRINITY_DN62292_c0_g1~~TRINITY_DN62292_c0_g1_i1.p1  ORF type:complete len:482 (+),score=77.31 TRINITY_DN62292_c0_g1_i1:52-1497(+)